MKNVHVTKFPVNWTIEGLFDATEHTKSGEYLDYLIGMLDQAIRLEIQNNKYCINTVTPCYPNPEYVEKIKYLKYFLCMAPKGKESERLIMGKIDEAILAVLSNETLDAMYLLVPYEGKARKKIMKMIHERCSKSREERGWK